MCRFPVFVRQLGLTNVQKKAGQFKKCRVRLAGSVNVMMRISADANAFDIANEALSNRYCLCRRMEEGSP